MWLGNCFMNAERRGAYIWKGLFSQFYVMLGFGCYVMCCKPWLWIHCEIALVAGNVSVAEYNKNTINDTKHTYDRRWKESDKVGICSLVIFCPNQTSNFSCTELNTYLGQPKWYKFCGRFRRGTYFVRLNSFSQCESFGKWEVRCLNWSCSTIEISLWATRS